MKEQCVWCGRGSLGLGLSGPVSQQTSYVKERRDRDAVKGALETLLDALLHLSLI